MKSFFPHVEILSKLEGYVPVLLGFDDGLNYHSVNLLRYERLIGNLDSTPKSKQEAQKLAIRILRDLASSLEELDKRGDYL